MNFIKGVAGKTANENNKLKKKILYYVVIVLADIFVGLHLVIYKPIFLGNLRNVWQNLELVIINEN